MNESSRVEEPGDPWLPARAWWKWKVLLNIVSTDVTEKKRAEKRRKTPLEDL